MSLKLDVEKFNGEISFVLWQEKVKDSLINQCLKGIVREGKRLVDMFDKNWFNLEEKVLSVIRIYFFDEIYYNILHIMSLYALWTKLNNIYMTKSLTSKTYLKRQLYFLRMYDSDSLQSHLHKFNKLCNDLLCIDEKIVEDGKAYMLINFQNSTFKIQYMKRL